MDSPYNDLDNSPEPNRAIKDFQLFSGSPTIFQMADPPGLESSNHQLSPEAWSHILKFPDTFFGRTDRDLTSLHAETTNEVPDQSEIRSAKHVRRGTSLPPRGLNSESLFSSSPPETIGQIPLTPREKVRKDKRSDQKVDRKVKTRSTDRLKILTRLLEISGRPVEQKFKCYLDLGCANGEIFSTNMAYLKPRKGYCADLYNNYLSGFIKVTDNKIPIQDRSVDLITCYVAIHHFPNPYLMINEIARVIMPGGYLFIREHDVTVEEETDVTAYLDLLHMMELVRHGKMITKTIQSTFHRRYWSRQDLSKLLATVGLEEVGFQRYVKHSNPQRIYHALYIFNPTGICDINCQTQISKTVEYSLDRNNLVVWLRSEARYSNLNQFNYSYYRWFINTIYKKLGLEAKIINRIIEQSKDDLDFFRQIFNWLYPNQLNNQTAPELVQRPNNRPRSNSSPHRETLGKILETDRGSNPKLDSRKWSIKTSRSSRRGRGNRKRQEYYRAWSNIDKSHGRYRYRRHDT